MADTARTRAEILALLANNISGDISPQDMRDVVVSLLHARGEIAITTPAATVVAAMNTWYPVLGTWTLTAATSGEGFDEPNNGQIRYTGAPARITFATATFSFESASGPIVTEWALAKNGTVIDESIMEHYSLGAGVPLGLASAALISMDTNDYLTLVVRNTTDTANITASYAAIVCDAMLQ